MEIRKRIVLLSIVFIVGLIVILLIPIGNKEKKIELIEGYYILKNSDTDVTLYKDNKQIINDYIAEYSYGKRFILIKSLDNEGSLNIKFSIIDTKMGEIYGPFIDYVTYEVIRDEIVNEETSNFKNTLEGE